MLEAISIEQGKVMASSSSSSSSSHASEESVTIYTPELLWHGGGNENGKPDPVYSVDMHPSDVLATAGIDANIPPKGSVRLWKVNSFHKGQEFLVDLNDHSSVVNCVRFSPCGKMLASSSDRQIIIYTVPDPSVWATVKDGRMCEKIFLRPSLDEIYDLQWSPDSMFVLAGAINSKAEIVRVLTKEKESLILTGHTGYVQGVAWDPLDQMVVTQSADRTCKMHMIKHKPGSMVKLSPKGHLVAKMVSNTSYQLKQEAVESGPSSAAETDADPSLDISAPQKANNLFADATVPSFFRQDDFQAYVFMF